MTHGYSTLRLFGAHPPVRRVLALDGGSRHFKLLLAESDFGRLRILREEQVDLQAEGLVSPEEIQTHVQQLLDRWEDPAVALVLPQHLTISQLIELPQAPESEIDKLIADEAKKLSGVSESRIVYDFVRLETHASQRQQFWVTMGREGEIRERIDRLGLAQKELCEITTPANALITAFQAASPDSRRAILVHLGAQTTVVVVLVAGQGVFATSFQMGGDFFTRALARVRQCPEDAAEALKRREDLLTGAGAQADFRGAVDGWVAELKGQLSEWFQHNTAITAEGGEFELIACGGGFDQPGLLEYLRTKADLPLQPWPRKSSSGLPAPSAGFEVAFGTALQALGHSVQPVSLLPEEHRLAWKRRLTSQRVELASFVLLILCVMVLALGTWRKVALINAKQSLLDKVRAGQQAFNENELLTADLLSGYASLRPILVAQQNTIDTLKTLSLLQQSRSTNGFWFVLLADQHTYFSQPPALTTNRPAKTNLLGATVEMARSASLGPRNSPLAATNASFGKPGYIAELCVPGEAEAARQVLSEVVNGLKQQRLFSKVDLLSDDLRRSLAEPKVTIPDRYYVLAFDFAETDFHQVPKWKRPLIYGPPRPAPKRVARQHETVPETAQHQQSLP